MVIAQNERDMGYPGYVRERPKFMGYLGRVYRQGLATFFQVKKRGRRVFFSEKKAKKIVLLPRGRVGTDFVKELTRMIKLYTTDSKWSRLAMTMLHVFVPLMLQKPSAKSKAKDHARYLEKRLNQAS